MTRSRFHSRAKNRAADMGRTALALLCLLSGLSLRGQSAKPTEYQLKAADLVAFGRYVEWNARAKPSPEENFDICVLGQDPFGAMLDTQVKGENIGGAPVVAKRITRPQDAVACRVLYIGASEAGQLDSIFAALGNSSVLTVADIPDFIKRGGMIQFVLDESRIRFEINLAVSRRSGMNLSSEMLKVARVVRRSL